MNEGADNKSTFTGASFPAKPAESCPWVMAEESHPSSSSARASSSSSGSGTSSSIVLVPSQEVSQSHRVSSIACSGERDCVVGRSAT